MITALDTETFPISVDAVSPKVVCASWARGRGSSVVGNGDSDLEGLLRAQLQGELVLHNGSYDLVCIAKTYPDLLPLIYKALQERRIHDTLIREVMWYLAYSGNPEYRAGAKIGYSLAEIAKRRTGRVLAGKEGDDVWRTRYNELDGMPARDYPKEAYEYARLDAVATLEIYEDQQQHPLYSPEELYAAEWLTVWAAFELRMSTTHGLKVDADKVRELEEFYAAKLVPSALPLLYEQGIIRPAQPPRPHSRGARSHVEGCRKKGCECPVKMTAPKPESLNKKAVQDLVVSLWSQLGRPPLLTETGQIATGKEVRATLLGLDDTFDQYDERCKYSKLVTSYFPAFRWPPGSDTYAETMHPGYKPLKTTGRVSSSGNRKGDKNALYPSVNVQQADPRVRPIYVAREGFAFVSCDYSSVDLVSFAQTLLDIYGSSQLADQINRGENPHTALGRILCNADKGTNYSYQEFESSEEDYAYYRKFAKPIGLGFPGGLGAATMVSFAAGYGVRMSEEEAKDFRELWYETYPNARRYLKEWVGEQVYGDHAEYDREAREYRTPLGMIRRGCTHTQCANGRGLQSPAAEGMKLAMCVVGQSCNDPSQGNVLYGSKIVANMHDELLVEVPLRKLHECAMEISSLMVDAMGYLIKDVKVEAEPCAMLRWDKSAKPVYENGRLVIWSGSES